MNASPLNHPRTVPAPATSAVPPTALRAFPASIRSTLLVLAVSVIVGVAPPAQSQIVRDATPGQTPGDLTPVADVFTLDGGDGIRRGTSNEIVIHSMDQFNLSDGETALFTDSPGFIDSVTNVLTRVTGGSASQLDGQIRSLYPNADLFFVNPNGVFFGTGFTIDVPRSFHVSTADTLDWETSVTIDLTAPSDIPVLTAAVPLAWGFLGSGPEKRIQVDGFNVADAVPGQVPEDEAFTFVGSELAIGTNGTQVDINTNGRNFLAAALGNEGSVEGFFDFSSPFFNRIRIIDGIGLPSGGFGFRGVLNTGGDQSQSGDIGFWGGLVEVDGSLLSRGSAAASNPDAGFIRLLAEDLLIDALLDSSGLNGMANNVILSGDNRIDFAPGTILRTGAQLPGLFGGNVQLFNTSGATRLTGSDFLIDLGTDTPAFVGSFLAGADIIDFSNFTVRGNATGSESAGTISLAGRQVRLSGSGANTIDVRSSGTRPAGSFAVNASEFVDFRNMTINASASGGSVSSNGGFVSIMAPQVTSDAGFALDQSVVPLGTPGTFVGTMPTVTSDPPAIDPPSGSSTIVRDGSENQTAGPILPNNNVFEINGQDGIRRDNNEIVIHSFDEFGLGDSETARFTETDSVFLDLVGDVFVRVTGNQSSQISGLIESLYTDADFTFVNPNGLFFGDGFALDTNAGFYASAADAIQLDTGETVDLTSPSAIPALTGATATVWEFASGGANKQITIDDFNFLDNGTGSAGDFLAFAGSDVVLNTDLTSNGRSVSIVAAGGASTVDFFPGPQQLGGTPSGSIDILGNINSNRTSVGAGSGDIFLAGGAVNVDGDLLTSEQPGFVTDRSGSVSIAAENLDHTGLIQTGPGGVAGDITIDVADTATFSNSVLDVSTINASAIAGDISVEAGNELRADGLAARVGTTGIASESGRISLAADIIDLESLDFDATAPSLDSSPGAVDLSGRIVGLSGVGVGAIDVSNAGALSAGGVVVEATESVDLANLTIDASVTGSGDGGFVRIDAPAGASDALFAVDVSSTLGTDGTVTGTFFDLIGTDRIVRDLSPGQTPGAIDPLGDVYEINGNDGIRRGPNDSIVIHSFDRFDLLGGETARYTDDAPFLASVTNVLSRVTGGQSSQINGRIESLYANADLFFVNPNGLFFGDGFAIDTSASFHASTGDSLEWDPGVSIGTDPTIDVPQLTGITPQRWNFQSGGAVKLIEISDITVDGSAAPAPNSTISFVGGDITLADSPSRAFGSQGRDVLFVAAGGAGSVDFDPAPQANGPGVLANGDLNIERDIRTTNDNGLSGDITLWGGEVTIEGDLETGALPTSPGFVLDSGDVLIAADTLSMTGDISTRAEQQAGSIQIDVFGDATLGNRGGGPETEWNTGGQTTGSTSGDIQISAGGELSASRWTARATDAAGNSNAGAIDLTATNIDLSNTLLDASGGTGETGLISLTGDTLTLDGRDAVGLDVGSSGPNDAGTVIIDAGDTVDFAELTIDAAATGGGNGGTVEILAPNDTAVTADNFFAVDISAAPPGLAGTFNSPTVNRPPPVVGPPLDVTTPALAPVEVLTGGTVDTQPPPVAEDAPFGREVGGGVEVADSAGAAGQPGEPGESGATDPGTEGDDEEERRRLAQADPEVSGELPPVGSGNVVGLETITDSPAQAPVSQGDLAALIDNEPEALVASASAETAEADPKIPGISLYTRAADRAPRMPRTCDVLNGSGSGSRFLARNPRRRPISSEDWLLAFDREGDQLIAESGEALPAVGSRGPGASVDAEKDRRLGELQRSFAAAAVAIRSDRYGEAADRFAVAVKALQEAGDARGAAQALQVFAQLQLEDGRFEGARENLERALTLAEGSGDEATIAKLRGSLGNALVGTGDLAEAESQLTRGLNLVLESPDKGPAPSLLNDLGNRHAARRDFQSAFWAYEKAAGLAQELGRVGDEARALAGAARVAVDVSRLDDAWRLLTEADALRPRVRNEKARAPLAIHIGHSYAQLAQVTNDRRSDALTKASAAFEDAVRAASAIGDEYAMALANLNLGALYQDEQHRSEALYLTRLARRSAERIDAPEIVYRAHWQEGQILWSAHRVRDALASHRRAIEILEETKPVASAGYGATVEDFQRTVGGVYRDHVDLLLRSSELATSPVVSNQLVVEARDTLEKLKGAELRDYFEDECIANVWESDREIGQGVAVVHTVTLPDRIELLLTLPSGVERYQTKISAARLAKLVDSFRRAVQSPVTNRYRPFARRLHEVIVEPYARRLATAGVETVVFVPDGRLRTLPFVALHDGEKFLGDRYATATTLSLNLLSNPEFAAEIGDPVLGGVSESVQGFVALDAVDDELAGIQNVEGGELLLNKAFTLDRVESAVADQEPGILHLATHAVFTGNPDTSFLLTYDGRVGFGELSDVVGMTKAEGAPLDLLVLSACETAVGNDRAGLGFTGSAIRAGARSAVGSLWPIADEAAGQLMVDFYELRQVDQLTKAKALQKAQSQLRADGNFDHPYYWAPFTLVNDWL